MLFLFFTVDRNLHLNKGLSVPKSLVDVGITCYLCLMTHDDPEMTIQNTKM